MKIYNSKNALIKAALIFCLLLPSLYVKAQSVGINTTGATPHSSALLDLDADDKGFLITRADTASIANPAFGLMTLAPADSCLYMHNGEASGKKWISMGGVGHDCPCGSATPTVPSGFTCGDSFTDVRDNNTYTTVQIGNQCWMAENLAFLPEVQSNSEHVIKWQQGQASYGVYGYDGSDVSTAKGLANYSTYGVYYNWHAAMDGANSSNSNPSGIQGACPTGWHLPSDAEWCEMENAVEVNTDVNCDITDWRGTNTGKNLKTSSWNGTNLSGFTALPGGRRLADGTWLYEGGFGHWWSSATGQNGGFYRGMASSQSTVYRYSTSMDRGYSVRCVRD